MPSPSKQTIVPTPEPETPRRRPRREPRHSLDPASIAAFLIPFGLIVWLGMERGGFEVPVYSQVGIAAWWLVAVGVIAGLLPVARVGRAGWIALALLVGFAAWTAIGVSWSSSSGRTVTELARVVTYAGVLAAALLTARREHVRLVLGAVAAACAVLATVAVLSRLHPSWFPENELPTILTGIQSRLAYPIGYWNAVAGLIAIGLPLVLWAVVSARPVALRALAAAAVPAMCLASYYTYSRGGVAAAGVALIALVALSPRRLLFVVPAVVLGIGSGFVIWQASIRHQLADGLTTATALDQGDSMVIILGGVSLVAAAVIGGLGLLERRRKLPRVPAVPRRTALGLLAGSAVAALALFLAVGGPGRVSDGFETFKDPTGLSETSSRLTSVAGNGRWQYWSSAVEAGNDSPLQGIGPGTFVFYWSQNRDINNGFVRDAHSLFFEAYGELGILGLLLIAGFVVFVIAIGVRRSIQTRGAERAVYAAATSGAVAFAIAAGADWLWEIAVIPVAFLFLAAATLRSDPAGDGLAGPAPASPSPRARVALRAGTVVASLAAIAVIAVPMLGDLRLTASQDDFSAGDLEGSLEKAQDAKSLEPYSAAPRMQEAFVYERMGDLKKAAAAALAATERESANWETFYVFARIQSQRPGKQGSALRALRTARELDPFNPALSPANLAG